jgi:hypothetical protein
MQDRCRGLRRSGPVEFSRKVPQLVFAVHRGAGAPGPQKSARGIVATASVAATTLGVLALGLENVLYRKSSVRPG